MVLLLVILVSSEVGSYSITRNQLELEDTNFDRAYVTHDPVNIVSNMNFSIQGWPGNGTSGNPYVIEDLEISSSASACVYIEDTDVYFVIRDCTFDAHWDKNCVTLANVTHGTIENCVMHDCSVGVKLYDAPDCIVSDNEISDSQVGISATGGSDDSFILRNNVSAGGTDGIAIYNSHRVVIENNTVFGYRQSCLRAYESHYCIFTGNELGDFERFGFFMYLSDYGEISRNTAHYSSTESKAEFDIAMQRCHEWTIEGNQLGGNVLASIELERSDTCTISNNSMNRGIYFESYNTYDYSSHTMDSNTVQGKQLGYFKSQNNLALLGTNYGQIILVYCDNVEVNQGTFSDVASTVVVESCDNVSLQNLSLERSFHGISLRDSTDIVIQNCVIEFTRGNAIYLYESNDLSVSHVEISSTTTGISQWGRAIYATSCDNLTISDSAVTDNTPYGIYLSSVSDSTLSNIEASGNYLCDIDLSYCSGLTLNACNLDSGIIVSGDTIGAWNHDFNNVMVGARPFGYFKNETGLVVDGSEFGQIIVLDSEHIQITGASMVSVARGICIVFSSNCSIVNAEISANERGCLLYQSQYCIIENVELTKARSEMGLGTQAGLVMVHCSNSVISNCVAHDLYVGFQISSSHWSNFTSCEILRNSWGFELRSSTFCNIVSNKFFHNSGNGLHVASNYTMIFDNEFWNQTPQATDNGWHNTWDNGIDRGNAWSDYSGTGVYFIEGTANATDRYPRLYVPPLIPEGLAEILPILLGVSGVAIVLTGSVVFIRKRKSS